jgi:hypothetical protein
LKSLADGVAHGNTVSAASSLSLYFPVVSGRISITPPSPSDALGGLQAHISAAIGSVKAVPNPYFFPRSVLASIVSSRFTAVGVGQADAKEEPLTLVRRSNARSRKINRPDGVADAFHVSRYKVEPSKSVFGRNLFAKDCVRSADLDKVEPRRP